MGANLADANATSDLLSHVAPVPREHDCSHADAFKLLQGLGGLRSDRVMENDSPEKIRTCNPDLGAR
jgi:hypothetical protein